MLNFALYTIIFWAAGTGFAKLVYVATQTDQVLDKFWKFLTARSWQMMLRDFDMSGNKRKQALWKILGGCQHCFTLWIFMFWFIIYGLFSKIIMGFWVTDFIRVHNPIPYFISWYFVNAVWFVVFNSIGWVVTLPIIAKQYLTKKTAT